MISLVKATDRHALPIDSTLPAHYEGLIMNDPLTLSSAFSTLIKRATTKINIDDVVIQPYGRFQLRGYVTKINEFSATMIVIGQSDPDDQGIEALYSWVGREFSWMI